MDVGTMAGIGNLIGSVGFPVVIAGYLVMRLDATLDRLTSEITRLSVLLEERLPRGEGKTDV